MSEFYDLTVVGLHHEPNDTLCVELALPPAVQDAFAFVQGQYLTFELVIDGAPIRRSYSICSAASADTSANTLMVAIKRIEGGAFSSYAHATFAVGMTLRVAPPQGQFFGSHSVAADARYLCIAAGSGITPILSIIKTTLAAQPNSRVTLLYGNRRSADIIFREQLLWLKNRYLSRFQWINFFSQETQDAPILNGRIDNDKGAQLHGRLIDITDFSEYYLCGPEGMISEVSRGLRSMGVDAANIHYELFFASAEDARAAIENHQRRAREFAGLTTQVRVRSGGREVQFELSADGENILDGAMNSGLDLPYSCKGGVCATCKAKVLAGKVDMDLNHALSAQEIEQGFILTCQAHPITREVLVDYDVI